MLTEKQRKVLGQRLSELREKAGVPASVVARDALGYQNGSHVAVTRLERAALAQPRQDHLLALSRYYAVPPEHLFVTPQTLEQAESAAPSEPENATRSQNAGATTGSEGGADDLPRDPADLLDFPSRVRWARRQAGLDVDEFAFAVRGYGALITRSNVLAWESGESTPNPVQLQALARCARRGERWFLHGQEEPAPASRGIWLMGNLRAATPPA